MVQETHKLLEDSSIRVSPTAVRVPVVYAHSEAIHLRLREPLSAEQARELLSKSNGLSVVDNLSEQQYPTPMEASGKDEVFVGRIRNDLEDLQGLNLWVVGDNVRKGAALNSVHIAEQLVAEHFVL